MEAQSFRGKKSRYSIPPNYSIERIDHKLVIQIDETEYAKAFRNWSFFSLLIMMVCILLFILDGTNMKNFIPAMGVFALFGGVGLYYYFRYQQTNRVVQWYLDQSFGNATYQKISPTFSELNQIRLSNINSLKCSFDYWFFKYQISFITVDNRRILLIAGVRKEDYESFKRELTEFLNVPIIHHRKLGTIAIFVLCNLFFLGIFYLFAQETLLLGLSMVFFAISGGYLVLKKDL